MEWFKKITRNDLAILLEERQYTPLRPPLTLTASPAETGKVKKKPKPARRIIVRRVFSPREIQNIRDGLKTRGIIS